jgi:hypothetical protein
MQYVDIVYEMRASAIKTLQEKRQPHFLRWEK